MFSIGATVLSSGILHELTYLYDYKIQKFNYDELQSITSTWLAQGKYSLIFKSIILNLVDVDPQKRLTNDELWSWISKYSDSIEIFIRSEGRILLKKF